MKPFFLISDTTVVILALIPSVFGVITLLVQASINARVKRVDKKQDKSIVQQAENHEQMDGHMTDLLSKTAELNKVIGKNEGKEEQKAKMAPIIEEKVKAAKDAGKIEGIEQEQQANGKKNGEENSNQ